MTNTQQSNPALVTIWVLRGQYAPEQKAEMIRRVSDVMAEVIGRDVADPTWVVIEEIHRATGGSATAMRVRNVRRPIKEEHHAEPCHSPCLPRRRSADPAPPGVGPIAGWSGRSLQPPSSSPCTSFQNLVPRPWA